MPSVQPGDSAKLCSLHDFKAYRNTDSRLNKMCIRDSALPEDADQEKISAEVSDGVLKIAIPKTDVYKRQMQGINAEPLTGSKV